MKRIKRPGNSASRISLIKKWFEFVVIILACVFTLHILYKNFIENIGFKSETIFSVSSSSRTGYLKSNLTEIIKSDKSHSLISLNGEELATSSNPEIKKINLQNKNVSYEAIKQIEVVSEDLLLSDNKPVTSDVRGNLGPPEVVTNSRIDDWLKDRWQAARSMAGDPIPGPHWLQIDLGRPCIISKIVLDWETAFSVDYDILGKVSEADMFYNLASSSSLKVIERSKQHVVQVLDNINRIESRYVKVLIYKPATQWGSSLWYIQIYGRYI